MEDLVYWGLILAGVVVVGIIFSFINKLLRRRRGYASPLGLFLSLCRAHKLKWSECWLLWRLSRSKHLTDPARVFLEPEWFKTPRLSAELRRKATQLNGIYNRLFAGLKGGGKLSNGDRSPSVQSSQATGAALPSLKAAPQLDILPWSATPSSPPSAPLTDFSDGTPV